MAIVWAVFEVEVIFLYFDLPFLADLPIDVRKDVEERGRGTMTSPPEEDEGIHTARPLTPRELTNVLGGEEEEDDEEDDGESTPILRNGYGSVQQIQKKPMKLTRKQKIKGMNRIFCSSLQASACISLYRFAYFQSRIICIAYHSGSPPSLEVYPRKGANVLMYARILVRYQTAG